MRNYGDVSDISEAIAKEANEIKEKYGKNYFLYRKDVIKELVQFLVQEYMLRGGVYKKIYKQDTLHQIIIFMNDNIYKNNEKMEGCIAYLRVMQMLLYTYKASHNIEKKITDSRAWETIILEDFKRVKAIGKNATFMIAEARARKERGESMNDFSLWEIKFLLQELTHILEEDEENESVFEVKEDIELIKYLSDNFLEIFSWQ